jgi:hypothetical protein
MKTQLVKYFLLVLFLVGISSNVFADSTDSKHSGLDLREFRRTGNCVMCSLGGIDFSGSFKNFSGANLKNSSFTDANLSGVNLSKANLSKAGLTRANLSGANLSGANLTGAKLSGANLSGSNLTDADLTDAIIYNADFTGVIVTPNTKLPVEARKKIFEAKQKQLAEVKLAEEHRLAKERLAEQQQLTARKALCSKKFPKEKNMITVKGFYIGMNICDAEKLVKEGKYKSVFRNNAVFIHNILSANYEGKVTKIYFKRNLLHDLFKSKGMSLKMFAEKFGKHYIKGKFMFEMEPYNDFKNNNMGYNYYNGEVGYMFFIKQNESGTRAESLTIEEVAKVSEGFGD